MQSETLTITDNRTGRAYPLPLFHGNNQVKAGKFKLMGFGHRVYKNYDPRARIIKQTAEQVFAVTGRNPRLDIALELEKITLNDPYFVQCKLYPNVDFYSGIIYQAMGFSPDGKMSEEPAFAREPVAV